MAILASGTECRHRAFFTRARAISSQLRPSTAEPGADRSRLQIIDVVGFARGTSDETAERCSMAIVERAECTDLTCHPLSHELEIRSLESSALHSGFAAA
jgi:hypothetical protein